MKEVLIIGGSLFLLGIVAGVILVWIETRKWKKLENKVSELEVKVAKKSD